MHTARTQRSVHTARARSAHCAHALCMFNAQTVQHCAELHARTVHHSRSRRHCAHSHFAHCLHALCTLHTHCAHFTHALCTLHARSVRTALRRFADAYWSCTIAWIFGEACSGACRPSVTTDHLYQSNSECSGCNLPFFIKNGPNWARWCFLPPAQHSRTPPPYFQGAGSEETCCRQTRIQKIQLLASVCTKMCHLSSKNGQKIHFWGQQWCFLPTPPPHSEGAESEKRHIGCSFIQKNRVSGRSSLKKRISWRNWPKIGISGAKMSVFGIPGQGHEPPHLVGAKPER